MSKKIEIELDGDGVEEVFNSPELVEFMEEIAEQIISRCDGEYEQNTYYGFSRPNVSIITTDPETYHRNLKNNELLKALKGSKK